MYSIVFPCLQVARVGSTTFLQGRVPNSCQVFLYLCVVFSIAPNGTLVLPSFFFSVERLFYYGSYMSRDLFSVHFGDASKGTSLSVVFLVQYGHYEGLLPSSRVLHRAITPIRETPIATMEVVLMGGVCLSFGGEGSVKVVSPTGQYECVGNQFLFLQSVFYFLCFVGAYFFGFFARALLSLSFLYF